MTVKEIKQKGYNAFTGQRITKRTETNMTEKQIAEFRKKLEEWEKGFFALFE